MHKSFVNNFFQEFSLALFNNNTKYYISAKFHACMTNRTILPEDLLSLSSGVKIAHSFLKSVSNLFHFIILSLPV